MFTSDINGQKVSEFLIERIAVRLSADRFPGFFKQSDFTAFLKRAEGVDRASV